MLEVWPFVFEGLILGLIGALIAFFVEWGIYALVCKAIVDANALSFIAVIPFQNMAWNVLGSFLLAGALIGGVGSALAIRKFLQV